MSNTRTLRILEIDGGGERGILPLYFLKKFVQLWGINQADIWKNFDVICGTSVGGIMALSMAFGLTLDEMLPFFTTQGPSIFSLIPVVPPLSAVRPNEAYKVGLILTNTPFYQSSGPLANLYGSGLLNSTLQTQFGTNTLQNLKTNVIVPAYEADTKKYVLFSNLDYPEFIGQDELISNIGLATGAAPVYLPPLLMNGHTYLDGGIYQNNPAQFGVTLGKMIKPNANRFCILSLGTGLGKFGFDSGGEPPPIPPAPGGTFETIEQIFSLFEIASTGGQESVSRSLFLESTYTLNQLYYYRFQPILDPTKNTELDNTDADILAYYEDVANEVFNDDIDNISTFLGHLTA